VQRCAPQVTEGDTAVEVAGRIWTAISRFGQYRAADAADWIGEIGWYVVEHNGGWKRICETAQSKDVGVWKAQLRDHAAATIRRHKAGVLGAAPTFGELSKGQQRVAALVGQVLKPREERHGSSGNDRRILGEPEPKQLDAENGS
jgi:hypothetical protein